MERQIFVIFSHLINSNLLLQIYEIITSKKQQIFISKKVSVEYTAFVTANMTLHIFFCHENMEVKHHDIYLK